VLARFWDPARGAFVQSIDRGGVDASSLLMPLAAELGFAKVLSYANHVGLYGEQLGQRVEHLGNFPQLLTHLGLISAATTLDHALAKAGHPDAARRRRR